MSHQGETFFLHTVTFYPFVRPIAITKEQKMKQLLGMMVLWVLSFNLNAQIAISGKIIDEKQKPIKSITILLLKNSDSSLVKSAISNDAGTFTLEVPNGQSYKLSINGMGYQKYFQEIQTNGASIQLPDIKLITSVNTLAEVTVTSRKPFLEQRADKLVVNVENSATAAGSTALEILQKVPGVIVMNEKITMPGKSSVGILIDGKASQYTDINNVLASMGANNIEKIEVMANPGARYDAQGGALINIILKKNANLGTNGTVSIAGSTGIYEMGKNGVDRQYNRVTPALSINHRKGKWNVYGNANYFHRIFFDYSEFDRLITPYRFFQTNYSPANRNTINYRVGVDFYVDKKNTFGFLIRGFNFKGTTETINNTTQTNASTGQELSKFQTLINSDVKRDNLGANLNWKHEFDSSDHFINMDIDFSSFQLKNNSEIINKLSNGSSYANNQFVDNPVQFLVLKTDYVKPLSKTKILEIGAKSSFATINNYLTFKNAGFVDPKRSVDFEYKENINAGYINFKQQLNEKWELITGLRAEQTVAKGISMSSEVLNRNYLQLFPSIFLIRKITKDLSTNIQYVRRVNRPSYQQQNPFIEYLDSLTYTKGNPLIRPEISDQFKIGITYQNQPFFSVSYNKTTDVIFENAPKQDGNLTFTTPENLAQFNNVVFELNFPLNIGKKITGFGGNQFIWNSYKANYLGGVYDQKKWNWQAYWQVSYKPRPDWNFEISGFYTTAFLNEFINVSELGNLNFAIQKIILEKKGRITLNFNDILFSQKTLGQLQYQIIDLSFRQWSETRNVRLSFTYSFGNQKLQASRARSTGSDAELNRVKTN